MRTLFLIVICIAVIACQPTEFEDPRTIDDDQAAPTTTDQAEEQSDREALQALLDKQPTYTATYRTRSEFRGEVQTGQETVTVQGERSKRSYQDESFYILDDEVYLCRDACYEIPQPEEPRPVNRELPSDLPVRSIGTKTVAGRTATCFLINETITDCRSDDGILLEYKRSDNVEFQLRAQSVSRNIPDDAFDLPARVRPIEELETRTPTQGSAPQARR